MDLLRMKQGNDPFSRSVKADALCKAALVMVKVVMCGRGAPDDIAILYRIGDDEARKLWIDSQRNQSLVGDKVLGEGPDDTGASDHIVLRQPASVR
jgi:ribonuclease P/MRP protein subunit POP1